MFHVFRAALAAILSLWSLPISAQMTLADVDITDPASILAAANQCGSNYTFEGDDLCDRSIHCGEVGCYPQELKIAVAKSRNDEFLSHFLMAFFEEMRLCDPNDIVESQYVNLFPEDGGGRMWAFKERLRGREYVSYCAKTVPGFELEATFGLRQWGGKDIVVVRPGFGAGSPSAMMWISREQYLQYRGAASAKLRPIIKSAIEAELGRPCQTNLQLTCALVPQGGKLRLRVLAPDGAMTGRRGNWEQTYWEIYPYWMGSGDSYVLAFDMPITSIRRWPVDAGKPTDGFASVDFDEGFETFRMSVMSRVADALEAEVQ